MHSDDGSNHRHRLDAVASLDDSNSRVVLLTVAASVVSASHSFFTADAPAAAAGSWLVRDVVISVNDARVDRILIAIDIHLRQTIAS